MVLAAAVFMKRKGPWEPLTEWRSSPGVLLCPALWTATPSQFASRGTLVWEAVRARGLQSNQRWGMGEADNSPLM